MPSSEETISVFIELSPSRTPAASGKGEGVVSGSSGWSGVSAYIHMQSDRVLDASMLNKQVFSLAHTSR